MSAREEITNYNSQNDMYICTSLNNYNTMSQAWITYISCTSNYSANYTWVRARKYCAHVWLACVVCKYLLMKTYDF